MSCGTKRSQNVEPSVMVAGVFSDSETIHRTGISAKNSTTRSPMLHSVYSRVPFFSISRS